MPRWYLVRHGETEWNVEGRVQGHSDTPLNERGRTQAQSLGKRFASTAFDAVYCSDLPRVMETANAILTNDHPPLETVLELREKHYGEWEGKTSDQLKAEAPDLWERLFEDNITFAPPSGESDSDLIRRVAPALDRIRQRHTDNESILIVSHGGTIRATLVNLLGLPWELIWRFFLANGSVSIVDVYPQNAVLHSWNDTSHIGI